MPSVHEGARGVRLSILIPVFNEEGTLETLLSRIRAVVSQRWSYEIILVDDESRDSSRQIIAAEQGRFGDVIAVMKSVNRGKGRAIREGLRHATGNVILIQDADLEYSPEDYPALIAPIEDGGADVVYGSRFLHRAADIRMTSRVANQFLTTLTNLFYGSSLTDMETCYKVFRADLIRSLPLEANRFDIETELTAKILMAGIPITEVPIRYKARTRAEGKKIGWRDGLSAIRSLVRYRLHPRGGEAANEVVVISQRPTST